MYLQYAFRSENFFNKFQNQCQHLQLQVTTRNISLHFKILYKQVQHVSNNVSSRYISFRKSASEKVSPKISKINIDEDFGMNDERQKKRKERNRYANGVQLRKMLQCVSPRKTSARKFLRYYLTQTIGTRSSLPFLPGRSRPTSSPASHQFFLRSVSFSYRAKTYGRVRSYQTCIPLPRIQKRDRRERKREREDALL